MPIFSPNKSCKSENTITTQQEEPSFSVKYGETLFVITNTSLKDRVLTDKTFMFLKEIESNSFTLTKFFLSERIAEQNENSIIDKKISFNKILENKMRARSIYLFIFHLFFENFTA